MSKSITKKYISPVLKASDMTLRDYFAGIALKETIKQFHILADELSEDDDFNYFACMTPYAKEAYQWADLMLEARAE